MDPEETSQDPAQPSGTGRFYSQEDFDAAVAAARQAEKEKASARISQTDQRTQEMQAELAELTKFRKQAEKDAAARQKAIEDAQRAKEEAELSAKELLDRRQSEWQAQREADRQETERQIAMLQQENRLARISAYIQRRVNEEADNIAPELIDFIDGDSPEEIEASIERVKAKTATLVENMRSAAARGRAQMPGVAPAGGTNGITQLDQPGDKLLTGEDISKMDMATYRALRDKIGMDRLHSGSGGLF